MTKIFLLVVLVLFTNPFGKTISIHIEKNALVIELTDSKFHGHASKAPYLTDADDHFNIGSIPGEEDGKMHFLHFDRVKRMRRRVWWQSLLRAVLLATYMSFLLHEMLACHS